MSPDGFGNYSVVILSSRDLEPIGVRLLWRWPLDLLRFHDDISAA